MKKIRITQKQYSLILESTSPIESTVISLQETQDAVKEFISNIYLNPKQKDLNIYLLKKGITWGEMVSYLKSVGVISQEKSGLCRVKNFFNKTFSQDPQQAQDEKLAEISSIVDVLMKDSDAPWCKKEVEKSEEITEVDNYPAGVENDPQQAFNQEPQHIEKSEVKKVFEPLAMNYEIALFKTQDGIYVFYYDEIPREELPNPEFDLNLEDLTDYANTNVDNLSKGQGVKDYENGVQLVKIDEPLKNDLLAIYSKDKKITSVLSSLEETTGAASSGSYSGNMQQSQPEQPLEETTTAASSGQYSQPVIWAKDKTNWKAGSKPQMKGGEIVKKGSDFKMLGTEAIFEQIAKQTNRTIEEVKAIVESRLKK